VEAVETGEGVIEGSKLWISVAAMAAALMAFLDISIVNVALADIRASFGTPLDQIGWVSTGYMMANVFTIPMTGWLQRRFGYRQTFTTALVLFTIASALCGLAWDLPSLVCFRVLQGIGGGAIIPTAQSIIFGRYPRAQHALAAAVYGLGAITGPLLGPTLGGYLIEISTWKWVFFINVPVGVLAAIIGWRHVREPGFTSKAEPIDLTGIVLLAVSMFALQYVLEEGTRHDWWESTTIVVLTVVAVVSLTVLIVHELEIEHPIVDLRVFANLNYTLGTAINLLLGFALFSSAYLFSLYCGVVMRYSAMDIGRVYLAAGAIQLFVLPIASRFGNRIDGRLMVGAGMVGLTVSLWMNGQLGTQSDFWGLASPQMVRAVSLGFAFIAISVLVLSDLPPHRRGNATGLFNLTRELGGSIGTAWMGMILQKHSAMHASMIGEKLSIYNPPATQQLGVLRRLLGAQIPVEGAYVLSRAAVIREALVRAFNDGFRIAALAFACGGLLIFFVKRPKPGA
jgi:DHA2 family multidrug resistance protein